MSNPYIRNPVPVNFPSISERITEIKNEIRDFKINQSAHNATLREGLSARKEELTNETIKRTIERDMIIALAAEMKKEIAGLKKEIEDLKDWKNLTCDFLGDLKISEPKKLSESDENFIYDWANPNFK